MTNLEGDPDTVYVIDEDTKQQIDQIYRAIYVGNGKPSLMTRIAALEGKMSAVSWVAVALGLLIIGFLFSLLTHQTAFNP